MSLVAITCESCGGSVAMQVGKRSPDCLFCGAERLTETPADETVTPPEVFLPFDRDVESARATFRGWARKRFWAPGEIRRATVELNALLVPAWTWSGNIETHWAALVKASTRSGKKPVSGTDVTSIDGLLVPSSQTLRQAELDALSPFRSGSERPFDAESADLPYELGSLTVRAARKAGCAEMEARHADVIRDQIGASRLSTSAIFDRLEGSPLLLPIWIGAYRVADKPYRVVLNGQTGAITGRAPISWFKVAAAAGAVLGLLMSIALVIAVVAAVA